MALYLSFRAGFYTRPPPAGPCDGYGTARFYIVLRSEHELYQVYLFGIFLWRDQTRAA